MRRDHAFPVLDVVIETVLAEGNPPPEKMSILRQLAFALRVSDMELMALMAMKGYAWNAGPGGQRGYGHGPTYGTGPGGGYVPPQRPPQGPDPYAVLGIDRNADDRAVKRAYRKLISEHHRSEEHTSELQSLMRISYAVFCLKKKKTHHNTT